jgi:hypothetical protein
MCDTSRILHPSIIVLYQLNPHSLQSLDHVLCILFLRKLGTLFLKLSVLPLNLSLRFSLNSKRISFLSLIHLPSAGRLNDIIPVVNLFNNSNNLRWISNNWKDAKNAFGLRTSATSGIEGSEVSLANPGSRFHPMLDTHPRKLNCSTTGLKTWRKFRTSVLREQQIMSNSL